MTDILVEIAVYRKTYQAVLTDDSYLLDSYDRKGGYSKLSAEK